MNSSPEIVKALTKHLQAFKLPCPKVCYATPAKAQKALQDHGYRIGAKHWYRCALHGADNIYHLTSL